MGQVLGAAAGSLNNSESWLGNQGAARAGAQGEKKTATLINRWAAGHDGATVLHDLRIPIPGVNANIDHIVVYGNRVLILDSKSWKPATYWTAFGRTFRGLERFAAADKKTLPMARDAIENYLRSQRIKATLDRPLLVVWPSSARTSLSLTWYRPRGARAVTGDRLSTLPALAEPASTQIVAALRTLLISN